MRAQAEQAGRAAAAVDNEVRQNRRVYDVLAGLDTSGLDADALRMLELTLRDFRRAGVDLDGATRDRLRELAERDIELAQTFERNLSEDVRTVYVTPEQLSGLPNDYIEAHPPGPDGRVAITTDYPDTLPFQQFAHDAQARSDITAEFENRGWPANDAVLREILQVRAERARLLGHPGWADYDAAVRMIGSGSAIPDFIERLRQATAGAADRDVALLVDRQERDRPGSDRVSWADVNYYRELVRRERFGVDAQEARAYFDARKVRAGLLEVTSRLFGLEYVERPDAVTWDGDVTTYDVFADGGLLGRIYLDLHPRAGKFTHAAQFSLAPGVRDVQLAHGALVCNFPRGLMTHTDVVILFHEFGHLVHAVVAGRQAWARFSGVSTELDFVEAPSQMLEEWAWDPQVLRTFATDTDGEPIPEALVRRMRAADAFGRGFDVQVQLYFSAISYGLHEDVPDDLTAYVRRLAERYQPFETLPDTHEHASFGHLADEGYSSAYYSYMWGLVIAKDLFSAFDSDDLLAPAIARRYRDTVLLPGSSRDASSLVEDFLGRPAGTESFHRWLAG